MTAITLENQTSAIRGRWAVAAMFLVNGFIFGSWAPQIPFMLPRRVITKFTLGLMSSMIGVSQKQLARDNDVPASRISGIVKGKRSITADTALRLAAFFKTSPDMWMTLQWEYDLRLAKAENGAEINRRVRAWEASKATAA